MRFKRPEVNMELRVRSLCLPLATLVLVLVVDGLNYPYNPRSYNWLGNSYVLRVRHKTVQQYAIEDLCNTWKGRERFLLKLTEKMCGLEDEFIKAFMFDLCYHRGDMLERWVSRLFDTDNMGHCWQLLVLLFLVSLCQGRHVENKALKWSNYRFDFDHSSRDFVSGEPNGSDFDCVLQSTNKSRDKFRHLVYYDELNFVYLHITTGNDTTLHGASHVISEHIWTWTFYGDEGALEFLNWPFEFGIWSMGLLNNYVLELPVTLNEVSGNCTDLTVGKKPDNIAISKALVQLVLELIYISSEDSEKYGPSFFCYRERMYIQPRWLYVLCLHVVCPFEAVQYRCCTYIFEQELGHRDISCNPRFVWHYDNLWWMGPIGVSLVLFAYLPLFLMNISFRFTQAPNSCNIANESGSPTSSEGGNDSSFVFFDGKSYITLTNTIFSPLIYSFSRIQSICSRPFRLLWPVLSLSVIGTQLYVDNKYLKAFVHESIQKGVPMGFRSMLIGFSQSSDNFLPYLGGPFVALGSYLVISSIFIALPSSLSRHLESGIPDTNSVEFGSPLLLSLTYKELLGSISIKRTHGFRKVYNMCLAQFYMLLNKAYWSIAIGIQKRRWRNFRKCKIDMCLLPIYICICVFEHILCVLLYGLPVVFFGLVIFRSYYRCIVRMKVSKPWGGFSVLGVCLLMMLLFACLTVVLFMICTIFLDACLFLTRLFIFTFTGIVIYPKRSYGYLIFTLTVMYYLVECIQNYSTIYTRILKSTIRVSKNLQRANDRELLVTRKGIFKGVKKDILEYVIERLLPRRKQAFLSLLKLCVVLAAIGVSLALLSKTDQFRDLHILIHVTTALFTCAIPKITRSMFGKADSNLSAKIFEGKVELFVREFLYTKTSFTELNTDSDSD